MADKLGRIWFEGNPWPNGHAIKSAELSILLTEDNDERWPHKAGAYLDMSIRSEDYYAEMSASEQEVAYDTEEAEIDADIELESWRSFIVWQNYHACSIETLNAVLGTRAAPFALSSLEQLQIQFEPGRKHLSESLDVESAFQCYILGHDAVADHDMTFRQSPQRPDHFDIDWTGAIALTYGGEEDFRYRFRTELRGIPFGGLKAVKQHELRTRENYPDLAEEFEWYDLRVEQSPADRERNLRDIADAMLVLKQDAWRFKVGEYEDWLVPDSGSFSL